jgi:hypothetical protein
MIENRLKRIVRELVLFAETLKTQLRMGTHDFHLCVVEPSVLIENGEWDKGFSDIV